MAEIALNPLNNAIAAVERALSRLDAVADTNAFARSSAAASCEAAVQEISSSWQQHAAQLETALDAAQQENSYLKRENARLANDLNTLQQEHLGLQNIAGRTVKRLDATVKQLDLILEH